MHILATSDVPNDAIEALLEELHEVLEVELSVRRVALFSLEPPSWINLFAKTEEWQVVLSAVAAVYVAELIKEAAKSTWKGVAKAASATPDAVKKLSMLAKGLFSLRQRFPKKTEIFISLPEPDEYFGASLRLSLEDLETVEKQVALFIHHLPNFMALIESHKISDTPAATGYSLSLRDDGSLQVSWFDQKPLTQNEELFRISSTA